MEKTKAQILCSMIFFPKIGLFWENVEKYCTVGQATDDNLAHAHCMLDTKVINTQSEYVIHILYTATMVTRTCLYFVCLVSRYGTTLKISVLKHPSPPPPAALSLLLWDLKLWLWLCRLPFSGTWCLMAHQLLTLGMLTPFSLPLLG